MRLVVGVALEVVVMLAETRLVIEIPDARPVRYGITGSCWSSALHCLSEGR